MRRRGLVWWTLLMLCVMVSVTAAADDRSPSGLNPPEPVILQDAGLSSPVWLLLAVLLLVATAGTVDAVSGEIERRRTARAWRRESLQLWPQRVEDVTVETGRHVA